MCLAAVADNIVNCVCLSEGSNKSVTFMETEQLLINIASTILEKCNFHKCTNTYCLNVYIQCTLVDVYQMNDQLLSRLITLQSANNCGTYSVNFSNIRKQSKTKKYCLLSHKLTTKEIKELKIQK